MECIQPTDVGLHKYCIIANSGGQGAKLKVAMQKLGSLGYIQGCCSFLTYPEIMNRVRHHLELSDYISDIKRIQRHCIS